MKSTILLALIAVLTACNNSSDSSTAKASDSSNSAAEKPGTPAPNANGGSEITVTLTGGTHAGTYTATSPKSTCSMGLTGEKSFGNQYSENGKKDNELSSVQMIVKDYEQAKKGTQDFSVSVMFGSLLNGTSYNLDPKQNQGSGTLTITEKGGGREAKVEGTTKEGVKINLVLNCKTTQQIVDGQLKEQ